MLVIVYKIKRKILVVKKLNPNFVHVKVSYSGYEMKMLIFMKLLVFHILLTMEDIICNQGLDHLATKTFGYLDLQSIRQCKKVSILWQAFIENQRFYWIEELKETKKSEDIQFLFKRYPRWIDIFKQFEKNEPLTKLKEFLQYLQVYVQRPKCHKFYGGCFSDYHHQRNPILNASFLGELEFLQLLDSCSIKLEEDTSLFGNNVLHWACKGGQLEIVKFLCLKENMINSNADRTPLHVALDFPNFPKNKGIIQQLVNYPTIQINATDWMGDPHHLIRAISSGNPDIVEIILNHPDIDVNIPFLNQETDSSTPLHYAVQSYYRYNWQASMVMIVKMLLEKGADVNALDSNGHTPLYFARGEIVEILKKKKEQTAKRKGKDGQ